MRTGFRSDIELPGISFGGELVEGGKRGRNRDIGVAQELLAECCCIFYNRSFGFVGKGEFEEISKRREMTVSADGRCGVVERFECF